MKEVDPTTFIESGSADGDGEAFKAKLNDRIQKKFDSIFPKDSTDDSSVGLGSSDDSSLNNDSGAVDLSLDLDSVNDDTDGGSADLVLEIGPGSSDSDNTSSENLAIDSASDAEGPSLSIDGSGGDGNQESVLVGEEKSGALEAPSAESEEDLSLDSESSNELTELDINDTGLLDTLSIDDDNQAEGDSEFLTNLLDDDKNEAMDVGVSDGDLDVASAVASEVEQIPIVNEVASGLEQSPTNEVASEVEQIPIVNEIKSEAEQVQAVSDSSRVLEQQDTINVEELASASFNEGEMLKHKATIHQLREERENLLRDLKQYELDGQILKRENLGLKAELDEVKIDLSIAQQRYTEELESMKQKTLVSVERCRLAEEKKLALQKEFDRLQQKVRINFGQIQQRERELESQLELVTIDSDAQIKSRDQKIMELKRKIDQLEFNMENAVLRERQSIDDKLKIQDGLGKIVRTLKGGLDALEHDLDMGSDIIDLPKAK